MDGVVTLDRRLANFRATLRDAEAGPRDGSIARPRLPRPADLAERLAAALEGEVVATGHGTYVRVEWPSLPLPVDRSRLATLPGQPPRDVPLICLDTETTGLGTAAGTYAFLVGLGWWDGDRFRTVQLLLPDQPDEPALLAAIATRIPATGWLVTYNGRGFDWPLLVTRYRMARAAAPSHAGHLDLLPLVRRIFRHRMADARLRTAEETLLGLRRHDDVDGWEIPGRYLDFLRGGSAGPLIDVAHHNAEDVRSLGRLVAHVETRLGDPAVRQAAHPGDLAGLASAFGRERRHLDALDCLDAALAGPRRPRPVRLSWSTLLTTRADDPPRGFVSGPAGGDLDTQRSHRFDRARLLADRARLLGRLGRHDEAFEAWQDLATGGGSLATAAWIEVAKALEHRRRDPAGALSATRAAQAAVDRARFVGRPMPRLESDLALRARRLQRRLHRAAGGRVQRPTSGTLGSGGVVVHASRTQSRSGSNEQAIVRRSPASALR